MKRYLLKFSPSDECTARFQLKSGQVALRVNILILYHAAVLRPHRERRRDDLARRAYDLATAIEQRGIERFADDTAR
jgi:hypothetical protein